MPGRVYRDTEGGIETVAAAAAEVGRIDERRARRVELHDEGVAAAAGERGLDGVDRGEVRRGGAPRDVGVAGGIHRDAGGRVEGVAADVGRVDERVAGRVELRQEAFKKAAAERALQGVGRGEVRRASLPGDVGVTGGIYSDPGTHVVAAEIYGVAGAAEVGGVDEGRARRVELGDEGVARLLRCCRC